MKVKNNSNYPKRVSGVLISSGDVEEVEGVNPSNLGRRLEVIEKSGDDGSDQNTKTENQEEDDHEGGE